MEYAFKKLSRVTGDIVQLFYRVVLLVTSKLIFICNWWRAPLIKLKLLKHIISPTQSQSILLKSTGLKQPIFPFPYFYCLAHLSQKPDQGHTTKPFSALHRAYSQLHAPFVSCKKQTTAADL